MASYSADHFAGSLQEGLAHLDEIVRSESRLRGMSESLVREYLTRNVSFAIGPREEAGLDLFLRYARELQSQPEPREIPA